MSLDGLFVKDDLTGLWIPREVKLQYTAPRYSSPTGSAGAVFFNRGEVFCKADEEEEGKTRFPVVAFAHWSYRQKGGVCVVWAYEKDVHQVTLSDEVPVLRLDSIISRDDVLDHGELRDPSMPQEDWKRLASLLLAYGIRPE